MHHGGLYGADYDRFVDRYDTSALQKMKSHYWTAKQTIISKLGKKEDDHLVASDAELDAKLEVFYSVKTSCENMLRCIENYQDYLCDLSQEENALGRFLKEKGKSDRTQAGKMMAAVGRAQSYAAQQRLALRVPLVRLYSELDVFTCRAVRDTQNTVDAMEKARTEYRGSLLWMKNVSEELDPDVYKRLDKYRTVQAQVKLTKSRFDKFKLDCLQKIDLLSASRCNLFSQILANYQNCLVRFWDKTAKAHTTVSDCFKGYQHYEFTVIKELAEPSKKLAELTNAGATESSEAEEAEKAEEAKDDELISLDMKADESNLLSQMGVSKSLEELFKDSPEAEQVPLPGSTSDPSDDLSMLLSAPMDHKKAKPGGGDAVHDLLKSLSVGGAGDYNSRIGESASDHQLLSELLQPSNESSFATDWEQAFGSGPGTSIAQSAGASTAGSTQDSPLHGAKPSGQGFLPSQLLDLRSLSKDDDPGSLIDWNRPVKPPSGPPGKQAAPGGGKKPAPSQKDDKLSSWYRMFADIDPLENPDALGNPQDAKPNA